jgi:hypothetical protein
VAKWRRMLGSSAADFEAFCKDAGRMKKVKGRVRKGIPDEFRGYVWQLLSGAARALLLVCGHPLRCAVVHAQPFHKHHSGRPLLLQVAVCRCRR